MEEKDFIFHPICVVPPERHYDSCKELKDDLVWYEKSRAYFYKHHPEFIPQKGQFEQVKLAGKKGFILLPTSLDYGVLYRGQGKYHGTCLPSLYRQELTEEEIFVEHVRIAEFRLFLEQFDVTRHFKECGYVVDYVGLAQHYGLKTDVLDVTSDIDISMFLPCVITMNVRIHTNPRLRTKNMLDTSMRYCLMRQVKIPRILLVCFLTRLT